MEILGDLSILSGDQAEKLAKALKTLLEWTNMSRVGVAVFPVNVLVQVLLGQFFGSLVYCSLPALVPGSPRADAF